MTLLGILFLVVALLVSVGIHELGHLVPAKRFGVKVSQYFIGFGPTLWSRRVNGTEYGIKLLPLGGFVRIAGMLPPGRPDRRTENRRGRLTLAEEARLDSAEEIAPGEEERAFWRLNPARKLVVMFGGPFTNLVLALVCLLVVLCGIGTPKPSSTVGTVSSCLDGTTTCRTPAPAAAAGMRPGDVIHFGTDNAHPGPRPAGRQGDDPHGHGRAGRAEGHGQGRLLGGQTPVRRDQPRL